MAILGPAWPGICTGRVVRLLIGFQYLPGRRGFEIDSSADFSGTHDLRVYTWSSTWQQWVAFAERAIGIEVVAMSTPISLPLIWIQDKSKGVVNSMFFEVVVQLARETLVSKPLNLTVQNQPSVL